MYRTIFTTLIVTLVLTVIMAVTMTSTAQADSFSFTDDVNHWDGWGTSGQNNRDVIGIPDFTTGSIGYENNAMTGFSVNYTVNSSRSLFNQLTSGDLFINTNNDSTWDYVVHLDGRTGGTANVYEFNVDYTDAGSYVLGTFPTGGHRQNHPASAIIDGLNPVAQVMWSGIADATHANPGGTISITGLDVSFDVLTVAYTVSCANDVVFVSGMSQTPIPATVWLLGSGLAGLVGLRRRNRATA